MPGFQMWTDKVRAYHVHVQSLHARHRVIARPTRIEEVAGTSGRNILRRNPRLRQGDEIVLHGIRENSRKARPVARSNLDATRDHRSPRDTDVDSHRSRLT